MVEQSSEQKEESKEKISPRYFSRRARRVSEAGNKATKRFIQLRGQQLAYARSLRNRPKPSGYFRPKPKRTSYVDFLRRKASSFGFCDDLSDAHILFFDDFVTANVEAQTKVNSSRAGNQEAWQGAMATNQMEREAFNHSANAGHRNESASVSNEALIHSLAGHAHTHLLENEVNAFANILNPIQQKRMAIKRRVKRKR